MAVPIRPYPKSLAAKMTVRAPDRPISVGQEFESEQFRILEHDVKIVFVPYEHPFGEGASITLKHCGGKVHPGAWKFQLVAGTQRIALSGPATKTHYFKLQEDRQMLLASDKGINICLEPVGNLGTLQVFDDQRAQWDLKLQDLEQGQNLSRMFTEAFTLMGRTLHIQYIVDEGFRLLVETQEKVGLMLSARSGGHLVASGLLAHDGNPTSTVKISPHLVKRADGIEVALRALPIAGQVRTSSQRDAVTWRMPVLGIPKSRCWSPEVTLQGTRCILAHEQFEDSFSIGVFLDVFEPKLLLIQMEVNGKAVYKGSNRFSMENRWIECSVGKQVGKQAATGDLLLTITTVDPADGPRMRRMLEYRHSMQPHTKQIVMTQRAWRQQLERRRAGRQQQHRKRADDQVTQHGRMAVVVQQHWRNYRQRKALGGPRRAKHGDIKSEYDAVLKIFSVMDFIKSKTFFLEQSLRTTFKVAEEKQYKIVAVVGLFNKGKSWLINRLFDLDLPSGCEVPTEGLSFYWLEQKGMLVVDSAGVQATVDHRASSDPLVDAEATESLLFDLIARIAHHIIVVVGDLCECEQRIIDLMHRKYTRAKSHNKELIVVHNLRSITRREDAKDVFDRQVAQSYQGQYVHLGRLVFASEHANGQHMRHIGLCCESSEAGNWVNQESLSVIGASLDFSRFTGVLTNLSELLRRELEKLLVYFLKVEAVDSSQHASALTMTFEDVRYEEASRTCGRSCREYALRLQVSDQQHITMKKERGLTALGEMMIAEEEVAFEPVVNVWDYREGSKLFRKITIECAGVDAAAEDSFRFEKLTNGIKVNIEKKPIIDEDLIESVHVKQQQGTWTNDFAFPPEEGTLKLLEDQLDSKNGVLTILFENEPKAKQFKLHPSGKGILYV